MRRCPSCEKTYDDEAAHCPVDGAALLSLDELGAHAGLTLDGRYLLEERIGAGGLGEVYRARHQKMGRSFAVKLLHPRLVGDPQFLARFDREARALSRLRHPCCVAVTDYGHSEALGPYIVMELVAGEPLSRRTRGDGVALDRALELIQSVLTGLEHAHGEGIIHRDLKPDNIMLVPDPLRPGEQQTKILDFGVAKIRREAERSAEQSAELTAVGLVLGTPAYMAPEQLAPGEQAIDVRADLYAVGVMLYELCCGQRPFGAERDAMEMLKAHLTRQPPSPALLRPALPAELVAIIERALARKPAERFATAAELRQALAGLSPLPAALAAEPPPGLAPGVEAAEDPIATDPTQLAASIAGQVDEEGQGARSPRITAPTAALLPSAREPRSPAAAGRTRRGPLALVVVAGLVVAVGLAVGLAVRGGGGGEPRDADPGAATPTVGTRPPARSGAGPAMGEADAAPPKGRAAAGVGEGRWSPPAELQRALGLWARPRTRKRGTRQVSAYLARHRKDTRAQLHVARQYLQAFWGPDGVKLVRRALAADPALRLDPATLVSLGFAYQGRAHWQARRIVAEQGGERAVRALLVGAAAIRDQAVQRNLRAHVRRLGGPRTALDRQLASLASARACGTRRQRLAAVAADHAADVYVSILFGLLRGDGCLGAAARRLLK